MTLSLRSHTKSIKTKSLLIALALALAPLSARSFDDDEPFTVEEESELGEYVQHCEVDKKDCESLREMYESNQSSISFLDTALGKFVIFSLGAYVGYKGYEYTKK